jgi:hypothetical protein
VPVAGSQISAAVLTPVIWFQTALPPVASTLPSASSVAVDRRRCDDIDCVGVTTGVPLVISITTAPFDAPPYCRMRPGWNIAALASPPRLAAGSWPTVVTDPRPFGST